MHLCHVVRRILKQMVIILISSVAFKCDKYVVKFYVQKRPFHLHQPNSKNFTFRVQNDCRTISRFGHHCFYMGDTLHFQRGLLALPHTEIAHDRIDYHSSINLFYKEDNLEF